MVNNNSSTRKKTTTKVDINVGPGLKQAQKCGRDKQLYGGVIQLYIKKTPVDSLETQKTTYFFI